MQTAVVETDAAQAREQWKLYQSHRLNQGQVTPVDREIEAIYKAIARGGKVIRALESIRAAGVNNKGLPKLAIVRADQKTCRLHIRSDGSMTMRSGNERWMRSRMARDIRFDFPAGTVPGKPWSDHEAIVPMIPPHHRPARALANYHILFEAEWSRVVPVDPMLLRRIGKGDTWLVCAAWDLTEVERAVLAGRL